MIKVVVMRKEGVWKEVLVASDEEVKKRCMKRTRRVEKG